VVLVRITIPIHIVSLRIWLGLAVKRNINDELFLKNSLRLSDRIRSQDKYTQLKSAITDDGTQRILVSGTRGCQDAFLSAILHNDVDRQQIVIAEDKEQAAYYMNTLDTLTGDGSVLFFPDSFKQPRHFEVINNNNVLIRTEAMNKMTSLHNTKEILVTYPEALFEKVVAPIHLEKQKIGIRKGEDLDVDTVLSEISSW